jgi:hypothetical protein
MQSIEVTFCHRDGEVRTISDDLECGDATDVVPGDLVPAHPAYNKTTELRELDAAAPVLE